MMIKFQLSIGETARRYVKSVVGGLGLGILMVVSSTSADDTEVFFGQVTTDSSVASNASNVLFILDDSLSMLSSDSGQVGSRLFRLRQAMDTILSQVANVNIGVVTLNGDDGGGPVRYPVTPIDKPVCDGNGCDEVVVYAQVDRNENDAAQSLSNGNMIVGTDELTIGFNSNTPSEQQIVGLRFEELGIPQGAVITSAVLEMDATQTNTGGGTLSIWADDSDSAAPFSSADYNLTGRTSTTETVSFNTGAWMDGNTYESEDLSNIIQELVDRPGWCGGGDVALMLGGTNSHSVLSQEGVTSVGDGQTPTLRVSYDSTGLLDGEGCVQQTLVYQVQGGGNDAQQRLDNDNTNNGNNRLWLPNSDTREFISAIRFRNLEIEPNTEIIDARMEFVVAQSGVGTPRIKVTAELTGHSTVGLSGDSRLSNLTRTGESVIWEEPADALAGSKIYTSDLAPVVQEIVNRPDWAHGNAINMLLEGDSTTGYHVGWAFNQSASLASRLYITIKAYAGQGNSVGAVELTARDELMNLMDELRTNFWTPQLGAQYEAAQYMLGGPVFYGRKRGGNVISSNFRLSHPDSYSGGQVYTPLGCDSSNPYDVDCQDEEILNDASGTGPTYISPMLDSCQSNHMVILGDGAPTADSAPGRIHSLIGDSTCGNNEGLCGAALAEWLANNDHAPHIPGMQNILTHTIAFNQGGSGLNLLNNIAAAGGTTAARQADSADELVTVFTSIIDSASSLDTSFTAPGATVNQFNRLSHREDIYYALFHPSGKPKWNGNLKRYKLGASGGEASILDADGNKAVDETTGFFSTSARSFWQHLDENGNVTLEADGTDVSKGGAASRIGVNGIENRKLYTFVGDTSAIPSAGIVLANGNNKLHEDNAAITDNLLGISAISPAADRALHREELLKWVRGLDRLDDDQDGDISEPRRRMGDPLHTNPVVVNYEMTNSDDVQSIVYMTTNEGFLHAIDTETGNELWAFSPEDLLENHNLFYENFASTQHPYGLDGPLSLFRDENNENLVIENGESAFLYSAMRRGGNSYYAFDISDPESPILKWVINGGPGGTPGYEELGQSWSQATLGRVLYNGQEREVLVFGAGYDTNQDADPVRDVNGNAVSMEHTDDTIGRGLFIVDAISGELIWSVSGPDLGTGSYADQRFSEMTYGIPGNIRILDVDSDGLIDQMYASDTGGQVWRFDIISDASGGADLLQGGVVADISTNVAEGHRRFYSEPDVALIQENGVSHMAISIGSGWRDHPLNDVVEDAQYVFRSPDVRSTPTGYGVQVNSTTWRPITESDLFQVNNGSTTNADYTNGWFLRLPDAGEKVLGRSIIFNNILYFTSYVPDSNVDACAVALGGGYFYALSIFDGQPSQDFDGDGNVEDYETSTDDLRYSLKHNGIPSSPSVLIAEGQDPEVFVGIEQIPTSINNLTSRTYWVDSDVE